MPRVLLLLPTTTYQAHDFIEAARKVGAAVVVGTNERQAFGQRTGSSITLDFKNPVVSDGDFDAVIATDDETSIVAARIARDLGLPHNSVEAAEASRNKLARRRILRDAGLRSPKFGVGPVGYPCVLKPVALAASRGVIRANNDVEFETAKRRIAAITDQQIIVESFIPGCEVALEGLLTDGGLRALAIFDKPDPLDGPFFEETIYVTPSRHAEAPIVEEIGRACAALGLRHGPIHAELRVNDEGPWVLEVAARSIGGRCSRALRFGTGISLEELILRHALGMELPLEREANASGVMMIPIPRRGVLRSYRAAPDVEFVIPIGHEVVPLPEGNKYLGFIFARGETPAAVEAELRRKHAALELVIA